MHFAAKGHDVVVVDNYLRRQLALATCSEALIPTPNLPTRAEIFAATSGRHLDVRIGDCCDSKMMMSLFAEVDPDVVVHYAEQPSAPYSMIGVDEARLTLHNNLTTTFNVIWSVIQQAPQCHIIKLGTMGEYGTPNIDIEEGWLDIDYKGRSDRLLYPRTPGSLYHTTKVFDTDLLWFYVRTYGLRVTDLMQGPVYGLATPQCDLDKRLLPNFHYDDIFGTLVNRFLVQAVVGMPLTVYGRGGQKRGYLNLNDTLQCLELAAAHPANLGELRIFNQFTEAFTVNEIADKVQGAGRAVGLDVQIQHIKNPRKEKEEHYYNVTHSGLLDLGLEPHFMTEAVLADMLIKVQQYVSLVDVKKILPRVRWDQ